MPAHGTHPVTIHDISHQGALVRGRDRIPDNCDALFQFKSSFTAARVAWSEGPEAGLSFYRELTPDEIGATVQPPRRNSRS